MKAFSPAPLAFAHGLNKAHGAMVRHGHAEKGLEPGQAMAAGIQPT